MKNVANPEGAENMEAIIKPFLSELTAQSSQTKKVVELCHVGKFLALLASGYRINNLSEQPDFVINSGTELIGLEHQLIVDPMSKEREGFFENILSIAESELTSTGDLPNFLANCYINKHVDYKITDKRKLIDEVKTVIRGFITTGLLLPNQIIDHITAMRHSQITLNANLGAWWQKRISADLIRHAIERKESKIETYIRKTVPKQWLLLVIGGLKDSSYEFENDFHLQVPSPFEKIFVMEDFKAKLFQVK